MNEEAKARLLRLMQETAHNQASCSGDTASVDDYTVDTDIHKLKNPPG
jgi:hypothetical protein